MRLFHEDIRDSLVQAGQKACGYMNCKLFVQTVTGIPKLDDLPSRSFRSVSDLTAGDVVLVQSGDYCKVINLSEHDQLTYLRIFDRGGWRK